MGGAKASIAGGPSQSRKSARADIRTRTEPVKDMPLEPMTFWKPRIVEILSRIAAHPKPFHDGSRAVVRHRCERYNFRKRESPKPVAKRQSGRLRCITVSPMREGQAPADFHTGRERGVE